MSTKNPSGTLDFRHVLAVLPQAATVANGGDYGLTVYDFSRPDPLVMSAGFFPPVGTGLPAAISALLANPEVPDVHCYCYRDAEGHILRHGVSFLRDQHGNPVGCVDVVVDITALVSCRRLLDGLLGQNVEVRTGLGPGLPLPGVGQNGPGNGDSAPATFGQERINELIAACLKAIGIPPESMTNHDRMRVVETIEAENGFALKGAVDTVAEALGVTRYTIYYYRKKLHR